MARAYSAFTKDAMVSDMERGQAPSRSHSNVKESYTRRRFSRGILDRGSTPLSSTAVNVIGNSVESIIYPHIKTQIIKSLIVGVQERQIGKSSVMSAINTLCTIVAYW